MTAPVLAADRAGKPTPGTGGRKPPLASAGRIGPNAIVQCMHALRGAFGSRHCADLMAEAGLAHHVENPPTEMVDEAEVRALHQALRRELGVACARALGREAGRKTGDYLLAKRIPPVMRWLLPRLPASWATRVLLAAVGRHAWTFCGSGRFGILPARHGQPLRLLLQGSATSMDAVSEEPLCDYFAATFERLFQVLVSPRTRVVETACMAMGAPACVFELRGSD